jgi:hypothetical protein
MGMHVRHSLRRTAVIAAVSGVVAVALPVIWLRFPSELPLWLVLLAVAVGGAVSVAFQCVLLLHLPGPRRLLGALRSGAERLPPRAAASLIAVLAICNGLLLCRYGLGVNLRYLVLANVGGIVAWAVGRRGAVRAMDRRTRQRPGARRNDER